MRDIGPHPYAIAGSARRIVHKRTLSCPALEKPSQPESVNYVERPRDRSALVKQMIALAKENPDRIVLNSRGSELTCKAKAKSIFTCLNADTMDIRFRASIKLPNRIARYLQIAGDLLDRLALG